MFTHNTLVQVRYSETDQMGVVHHGNYASYLELSRIDWLNSLGISYREMEKNGIMLPVYDMKFSFIQPAYFDDTLTVETTLKEMPRARIIFSYKIFNSEGNLLTTAETTLVFVDMKTGRPVRCPDYILEKLKN